MICVLKAHWIDCKVWADEGSGLCFVKGRE